MLYGLKLQGYDFELKGGTSLSKGYKVIERFSEDIDIHIKPPADQKVTENPKNEKLANDVAPEGAVNAMITPNAVANQ